MPSGKHSPVVLLLKGLPCSGKSTLADCLSQRLLWPVVDKDDGRDCLSKLDRVPTSELNLLSYDIMLQIARRQVHNISCQTVTLPPDDVSSKCWEAAACDCLLTEGCSFPGIQWTVYHSGLPLITPRTCREFCSAS